MNICIVSSWVPSKKHPAFAPYVYNFAQNLDKFGINVSLVCPLGKGEESVTKEGAMTIYRVNERFPAIPLLRLIGKIKPDVIHVHAPNFFSCSAIFAAKLRRIPIIATVHRAEIDKLGGPMFFLRKHALARFEKIIAVSDYTKTLALKAGVKENKICVIHNSCDETFFSRMDKVSARIDHNLPIDKKIILFVGNLIEIKGVHTLIESLKSLSQSIPDLLLLIIGQGQERARLESLVVSYHLENNIKFQGWLPQRDLPGLYNAADIFVLPSMAEGHSIALLEAMAVGLPIVASRVGGNLESIEDGTNGFLFESGSADKLAEKLYMIFTDTELRRMMAAESYKKYHDRFSTRNQINSHLKIYQSLIGNNVNYQE